MKTSSFAVVELAKCFDVGGIDQRRALLLHDVERLFHQRVDGVAEAEIFSRHADAGALQAVGIADIARSPFVICRRWRRWLRRPDRRRSALREESPHRARCGTSGRRHPGCARSGMMPLRLTSPTVGLIPASPFDDDGQTIEPSVSVPIPAAAKFAEMPAPVPELDPQGLRSSA